jgi:hypothetical protein
MIQAFQNDKCQFLIAKKSTFLDAAQEVSIPIAFTQKAFLHSFIEPNIR